VGVDWWFTELHGAQKENKFSAGRGNAQHGEARASWQMREGVTSIDNKSTERLISRNNVALIQQEKQLRLQVSCTPQHMRGM